MQIGTEIQKVGRITKELTYSVKEFGFYTIVLSTESDLYCRKIIFEEKGLTEDWNIADKLGSLYKAHVTY